MYFEKCGDIDSGYIHFSMYVYILYITFIKNIIPLLKEELV